MTSTFLNAMQSLTILEIEKQLQKLLREIVDSINKTDVIAYSLNRLLSMYVTTQKIKIFQQQRLFSRKYTCSLLDISKNKKINQLSYINYQLFLPIPYFIEMYINRAIQRSPKKHLTLSFLKSRKTEKIHIKIMQKKQSIKSQNWSIEKLPGLSKQHQKLLIEYGITTTRKLLEITHTPQQKLTLANQLQIHLQYIKKWVALADLARVPSISYQYCGLLLHAGIASVTQLAQIPTHRLHQQILKLQVSTMQRRDLCPTVDLIQKWIQQAQFLSSV
ncbi:MAG: DUF4332 domain-containing protein [Okeania sp. SIO3C4]|nr:DUF4332 domain-containing protein [Okeania sp. SIO3C4]